MFAYRGGVEDDAKGLQQRDHLGGDQVEPDTAHADAQGCKACIHPAKQSRLKVYATCRRKSETAVSCHLL